MKFLMVLFLLLTACGMPTAYELQEVGSASNPLFIVTGGRTSCSTDYASVISSGVYRGYFRLESWLIQNSITPNKILVCITDSPQMLKYKENDKDEKEITLNDLLEFMENNFARHVGSIFVIGYSHGGWVSMKLASQLKAKINLFTIDPISISCLADNIAYNPDCVHAPTDLDNGLIKENIDLWHNYYETESYFLRSTEIKEAINKKFKYEGFRRYTGHYWISHEQQVWDDIKALF